MNSEDLEKRPVAERRVGCLVAYLSAFRLIDAKGFGPWSISIDDVNRRSWDYVQLHQLVGGLDVGLEAPYHMVVGRDGALGLPSLPEFRSAEAAVELFNRCLAGLLVGGVFCDAITLDGIETASVLDWKYIRVHSCSASAPNRFHRLVRGRCAPPIEAIQLLEPRTVSIAALSGAMAAGRAVLARVPEVSPEFLLKGASGFARRDWATALASLWIVVEQLTSHLWRRDIMPAADDKDQVEGRRNQLKDTRTYSVAVRQELLFQKGVIGRTTLQNLFSARRSRNELSHSGKNPTQTAAEACYQAVRSLLQSAVSDIPIPLLNLDLSDHAISDPFAPAEPRRIDPKYWMEILKLPGEHELELKEAATRECPPEGRRI